MTNMRVIHFVLSPEDSDLIAWKNSLPKRRFNQTVCEILVSESKGKLAVIPHQFSSAECSEPVHCLLRIQDENAIRLIDSIEPGEITPYIKKIIRKHIRKNREMPKDVHGELLRKLLYAVKTKMDRDKQTLDDYLYDVISSETYGRGLKELFSSIVRAYKSGDEKRGDELLKQFADEKEIESRFHVSAWYEED